MKLYDVVFTQFEDKIPTLGFVEVSSDTNSKYKSIYLENSCSQQRYFLSKDIIRNIIKSRKDKSKQTYPELFELTYSNNDIMLDPSITDEDERAKIFQSILDDPSVCEYDFKSSALSVDARNFNVVFNEASENSSNLNLLSIAVEDESYQLVDYVDGARIIQTGRRNGYRTCLITIPNIDESECDVLYVATLILRPVDEEAVLYKYNIFVTPNGVSLYKYDLAYSDPLSYLEYIELLNSNEKYYKCFKPSNINGIPSEVVLVNTKYLKDNKDGNIQVPVIDNSEFVDRDKITVVIPCTDETLMSNDIDEILKEKVTSKNIRVVTAIGVKANSDFYRKYKILYMYSYSPKTGLSSCIKSN